MNDCSYALGNAVKRARAKLALTQSEVAEKANMDVRTVLNIENNRGNPKLKVLSSLIHTLKIDSREIFNPEIKRESTEIYQLRALLESCSQDEAETLIPVIESILHVLRSKHSITIE